MKNTPSEVSDSNHANCGHLLALSAAGDRDAARSLYDLCVPGLRAWLGQRVPGVMADEFAHEAMVMAFRRARQFRAGASFHAWVRTMAWRLVLNALRNESRRRSRENSWSEGEGTRDDQKTGADEEVLAALERSVESLPWDQRQLVHLRYDQDRSAGEIAATMGRSRVSVAVSLHRICKRLRADMELRFSRAARTSPVSSGLRPIPTKPLRSAAPLPRAAAA